MLILGRKREVDVRVATPAPCILLLRTGRLDVFQAAWRNAVMVFSGRSRNLRKKNTRQIARVKKKGNSVG